MGSVKLVISPGLFESPSFSKSPYERDKTEREEKTERIKMKINSYLRLLQAIM